MAEDCDRHRGPFAETDPIVTRVLEGLPENQSGAARHRCAYCAYECGVERGRELERHRIAKLLGVTPEQIDELGS